MKDIVNQPKKSDEFRKLPIRFRGCNICDFKNVQWWGELVCEHKERYFCFGRSNKGQVLLLFINCVLCIVAFY